MDRYALTAWTARVLQLAAAQRPGSKATPLSIDAQFMAEVAHLSVLDNGPAAARDYLTKHGVALVVEARTSHARTSTERRSSATVPLSDSPCATTASTTSGSR